MQSRLADHPPYTAYTGFAVPQNRVLPSAIRNASPAIHLVPPTSAEHQAQTHKRHQPAAAAAADTASGNPPSFHAEILANLALRTFLPIQLKYA